MNGEGLDEGNVNSILDVCRIGQVAMSVSWKYLGLTMRRQDWIFYRVRDE